MNSLGGPPTLRCAPSTSTAAVDVSLQALKLVLRSSSINPATQVALRQTSYALHREVPDLGSIRKPHQHHRRWVCTALRAVVHQPADHFALSSNPRILQQALERQLDGDGSLTAQDVNLSVRGLCQVCPRWPDIWRCSQLAESAGITLEQETYAELWKAAIKAGWVAHAAELFRRSAAVWGVPGQKAYTTAISLLLQVRPQRGMPNVRLAYQLWRELFDAHRGALDAASVRAGVDACAQAGKLQEAEKLINWALGNKIPPGLGSYNRLLASYAEMGDMQGARKVYLRLKERYMPDIFTWNTLVAGYARAGDIARVRAVVEDAKRNGCQPDAWTWASLVNACAKAGDMQQAESVMKEMLELQQAQQAAYAVASQAAAPDALLLAGGHPALNGRSSSSSTPYRALNGQSSSTWANGAHSSSGSRTPSTSELHPRRSSTGPSSRSHGVQVLPLQQGAAQRIAVNPPRPLVSAHAYAALADGYMRLGDSRAAERAAQRLQSEAGLPPSRVVYNTLIRGYSKLGVVGQARALELLQEMRAAGVKPGPDTYTALIIAAESLGSDMGEPEEQAEPGYSSEEEQALVAGRQQLANPTSTSNGTTRDASYVGLAATLYPPLSPSAGRHGSPEVPGGWDIRSNSSSSSSCGGSPGPPAGSNGSVPDGLALRAPVRLAQHQQQLQQQPSHLQLQQQQQERARLGSTDATGSVPPQGYQPQIPGLGPAAQALGGRVGQYVRQLGAEGLPPDAAFLTALMMVHARAGRYSLALQVFDELRSSPHAATDVPSWSAVTAVHAMQGNMQEAEAAAQQAANLASSQGRPPPVTAFGALVRAYVRQSNLPPALAALKQFMVLGGRPSTRLLDPVVLLCLRKGDRQAAAKVIRAAELTGVPLNKDKYRAWFARGTGREGSQSPPPTGAYSPGAQSPGSSSGSSSSRSPPGSAGGGGTGSGQQGQEDGAVVVEKLKWWFGLPNNYYSSDWKAEANAGNSSSPRHPQSQDSSSSSGMGSSHNSGPDTNGYRPQHKDSVQ